MERILSDVPIYRLVDDDTDEMWMMARGIEGFYVDPRDASPEHVRLLGPERVNAKFGVDIPSVALRVIDLSGRAIGRYFVGRVRLISVLGDAYSIDDAAGIIADFHGYVEPFPLAGAIWHRWVFGGPVQMGEWSRRAPEWHGSWLHVVQNSWFEAGHEARMYGSGGTVEIDGSRLWNEASFYCAIGEAVNGPGGYFGSTLDGLLDCARSSRDKADSVPFELVWRNHADSRERLGSWLVGEIVDILSSCGVEVALR